MRWIIMIIIINNEYRRYVYGAMGVFEECVEKGWLNRARVRSACRGMSQMAGKEI
jgi:hypothetical protein